MSFINHQAQIKSTVHLKPNSSCIWIDDLSMIYTKYCAYKNKYMSHRSFILKRKTSKNVTIVHYRLHNTRSHFENSSIMFGNLK